MDIVITDPDGNDWMQTNDFELNLQYGEVNDFELVLDETLVPGTMFHVDGTPWGGIVDKRCPETLVTGDSITYKGRSLQGLLESRIIVPPSGQSHYVVSGDANAVIGAVISKIGLDDIFEASSNPSGAQFTNYRFSRYVDAWNGLRMALASLDMRMSITCKQGKFTVEALPKEIYGGLDSEKVYFKLDCEDIPINHLIGLGKGQGVNRAVCNWYADANGNISTTQTQFGVFENTATYHSNNDELAELSSKTKSKLKEHQTGSKASVTLPEGEMLDIGDFVVLSNATYNIEATTQVICVVIHVKNGDSDISYDFGIPIFPSEED